MANNALEALSIKRKMDLIVNWFNEEYTWREAKYRRLIAVQKLDDEFALINKGIANCTNADYLTYREYVNECKSKAKI